MEILKFKGGARVGNANVTWPLASLSVSKEKIELNASVAGNYVFLPEQIISLEPVKGIINKGIRIIHNVGLYDDNVIFWTFSNPETLIEQIKNSGFLNSKGTSGKFVKEQVAEHQKEGGFPLKKTPAIVLFVIWNLLFLIDFIVQPETGHIGIGVKLALFYAVLISFLFLFSEMFRNTVMKKGRELKDISAFVYFILFLAVVILGAILFLNK